jgi:hypothetical protein
MGTRSNGIARRRPGKRLSSTGNAMVISVLRCRLRRVTGFPGPGLLRRLRPWLTASMARGCCYRPCGNDIDAPEMLCVQHRIAIDAVAAAPECACGERSRRGGCEAGSPHFAPLPSRYLPQSHRCCSGCHRRGVSVRLGVPGPVRCRAGPAGCRLMPGVLGIPAIPGRARGLSNGVRDGTRTSRRTRSGSGPGRHPAVTRPHRFPAG